ncbi:DoxX family protein [Lentzea tibetensis]|uniref:DoxX family protein n=1 Tax=Lentzea tibetensis TaxID=2591470 RepID=A0A563ENI7_9PSEU|nr:DoxX family protein [Lentzea tibetensis]TWP48826.1 DoxX family protein [Lentzea tibetensis]
MAATETRTSPTLATKLQPGVLAGFRIVVSFLFILHGTMGLFGAFGGVDGQGGTVSFPTFPDFWGSAIPFGTGILILLGLFTRPAAVLASGSMAFAYFVVHIPMGGLWPLQNGGELAAMFSWIFLLIAAFGPGALALDNLRRKAS